MYNKIFEDACKSALSLAEADELNAKIDTLDEKITNMSNSIDGTKTQTSTDAVTPEWLDSVVDLTFLSPEDEENYKNYSIQNNDLTAALNDIYMRVEALNNDRAQAVDAFDITRVIEIDAKLADLKSQYKTKYAEGEQLRKKVVGKRDEWEASLSTLKETLKDEKWDKSLNIDKTKYSPGVLKEYRTNKTIEMVEAFVNDFPKSQQAQILNNARIKQILGDDYNRLVEKYL